MVLRMLSTHYEWSEKRAPFSRAQVRARVGSLVNDPFTSKSLGMSDQQVINWGSTNLLNTSFCKNLLDSLSHVTWSVAVSYFRQRTHV